MCVCVRTHQPTTCNIWSLTNTLVPDSVKVSAPEKLELRCQHSPCDDVLGSGSAGAHAAAHAILRATELHLGKESGHGERCFPALL